MTGPYPEPGPARDAWILSRRGPRNTLDPFKPYALFYEEERTEQGDRAQVATVFLTNRECPWRCVYCDLWRNTLPESVPPGAIPAQIDHALSQLAEEGALSANRPAPPRPRHLKLYNAGSFFDPRAIPPEDYPAIAAHARGFERVIVECHPALVNERVLEFRDLLSDLGRGRIPAPALEVAMGLETVHADILPRLNKRMTLPHYRRAAEFLRAQGIAVRAFILVKTPWITEGEALDVAKRSLEFAFGAGASVAVLIPTRPGNGAIEALMAQGEFAPPRLATLEAALEYGIGLGRGRVFADTWELSAFADCLACFPAREARLVQMNLEQSISPARSRPPSYGWRGGVWREANAECLAAVWEKASGPAPRGGRSVFAGSGAGCPGPASTYVGSDSFPGFNTLANERLRALLALTFGRVRGVLSPEPENLCGRCL